MNKLGFSASAVLLTTAVATAGVYTRPGQAIIAAAHASRVEPWEHGFKTPQVIATRYKNNVMGYNISFAFPQDPNNCDRAELFEFFSKYDGWVYQGGGAPGAPLYVVFKDVKDRESATAKLRDSDLLPALSRLVVSLR